MEKINDLIAEAEDLSNDASYRLHRADIECELAEEIDTLIQDWRKIVEILLKDR